MRDGSLQARRREERWGAIRAVANSGVGEIRVVTSKRFDQRDLLCYSSGATDHLEARVISNVAEAVADCSLVIGTSRRLRDVDAPPEWPAAGLGDRLDASVKTAILFGCERTGLTRDELVLCSATVAIPTVEYFPSMNLAHAVACLSYELARPNPSTVGPQFKEQAPKLSSGAREAFYTKVKGICEELGYPHGRSPDAFVRRLRKILHRANLNQQEMGLLGGVFSEMQRLSRSSKPEESSE